jgi:methionyl-tRNA synthetase
LRELQPHIREFRFDRALDALGSEVDRINREIASARPWEAGAPQGAEGTRSRLSRWAGEVRELGVALGPFLPGVAATIQETFAKVPLKRASPLFPRLAPGEHLDLRPLTQ